MDDIAIIRAIIDKEQNRAQISRLVCQALDWRKPDGGLKAMSCRVAMLRMQEDGIVTLPPPRHNQKLCQPRIDFTAQTDPQPSINTSVHMLPNLRLKLVEDSKTATLFREYIHRYHYLGYTPLSGAQLRYMACVDENVVALLSFSAAAWSTAPRDKFIGWTPEQRKKKLHLIVNNSRFLILPWVISKNLGSKLLAMAARKLKDDWLNRYGYSPALIETFVEEKRFQGTCYMAANYVYLGQTKGRGKLAYSSILPIKKILVCPLMPHFRNILCEE